MKQWFTAFFMCWGMFLSIPCPVRRWDEDARSKMLRCLPLIGLIVGGIWALCAWLLPKIGCPLPLQAAVLTAAPWLCTGCIHLDGYMDVCDAVFSRRDLKTRQQILKDSHCGAFAVIAVVLLALFSFAAGMSRVSFAPMVLPAISVAVRAAAAIALSTRKPMQTSQYAAIEKQPVWQLMLPLICLLCAVLLPAVFLCSIAPLAAAAAYALACWFAYRSLGGMSGDVSGFSLVIGEFAGFLTAGLVVFA